MKKLAANILLAVSVLLIIVVMVCAVAGSRRAEETTADYPRYETEEEVYYLSGHDLAEFSDVIVERFHEESALTVYSVEISVSVDLKQTGLLDMDILNKTQKVTYRGNGRFFVDLSGLGKHSVSIDEKREAIVIEIPHTQLAEIEIDPDRFSFEEAKKGLLAFGDLKFTAKEYNDLETECKSRIRKSLDINSNYVAADARAVEEMTKIYEPIVKAVDSTYHVEIEFIKK